MNLTRHPQAPVPLCPSTFWRAGAALLLAACCCRTALADNLTYNSSGQLITVTTSATVAAPVIVSHPASTFLETGQPLALAVTAAGSGLSYQWYKEADPLPGQTRPTLVFPSISAADVGSYTVRVTNSGGTTPSNPAVLSFPPNPFTAPMGNVGTTWATNGTTLWHVITDPAQTRESGNPVVGTGRAFEDDSDLQATFTVTAPTTVRYWMRLPAFNEPEEFSGQLHSCRVDVHLNGTPMGTFSDYDPGSGAWHQHQLHLPAAGTYTVRWQHTLNGYVLVDDVTLSAAPDTDMDGLSDDWETEFLDGLASGAGDDPDYDNNSNLVEYNDRTDPGSYSSRLAHVFLVVHGSGQIVNSQPEPPEGYPLFSSTSLELTAVPEPGHVLVGWQYTDASYVYDLFHYPLPVQFYGESVTYHAWFEPEMSLAEGADTTAVTWATGGDGPWFTQSRFSMDGSDAIMSGMTPVSNTPQTSWVEATVTGPAKFAFDFRNNSSDSLTLTVDDMNIKWTVPYDSAWHQKELSLPPGTHTVRWTRQATTYAGQTDNYAALDRVVVTPQTDSDSDGMADEWELEYFETLARDGTGDFDNDGVSDLAEHQDLTDPSAGYEFRTRLQVNVAGSGSVSVSPQRSSYVRSDTVVVTAVPAEGWELLQWEGVPNATANPLSLQLENASTTLTARFIPAGALNEALDNATQAFTNSLPGWTQTTAVSHDGVDAAQAPAPSSATNTQTFTTAVTGPAVLAFWWRFDKTQGWSSLVFTDSADSSTLSYPDDSSGWQRVIVQLAPGQHTLGWGFTRGDYAPEAPSNAWVDQVMIGADGDQDGLPDEWEVIHFGSTEVAAGADDSDNDDNSNQIEWADGTNPNSAASALYRLTITADRKDSVAISPLQGSYTPGTPVTLTADAAFTAWSGDAAGSTNPLNVVMDANKTIYADFQPLSRAVDNTKLIFQSGPVQPWQIVEGAGGYGFAGNDAAVTPPDLPQGASSSMQTTLTGGGRISFKARGAFVPENGAVFRWLLDGAEVGRHTLGYWNTMDVSFYVPPGTHTVQWAYVQGSDPVENQPGAAVDEVVWTPLDLVAPEVALDAPGTTWTYGASAVPTWLGVNTTTHDGVDAMEVTPVQANGQAELVTTVDAEVPSVVSFWWKVSSEESFDFLKFTLNGQAVDAAPPISGEQDWQQVSFLVPAGTHTLSWAYQKDGFGDQGQDRAWLDTVSIVPVQTFSLVAALDSPDLTWTTSSSQPWAGGNLLTHDGVDAAATPDNMGFADTSWVETQFTGPGTVSFWWKVSGEQDYASLRCLLDGAPAASSITGEVEWTQVTVSIPAGSHTLRWSYEKNYAFPVGADKAWLDEVTFTSTAPGMGSWASGYGLAGADAQPAANPSGDGIPNLLKYAFNLPPNASVQGAARHVAPGTGGSGLPATSTTGAAGSKRLRLEYVRRRNAADITYTVQFGSGLNAGDWSTASGTETVTIIDADWERVVIEDTVTSGTSSRRFGRVQVTQNP